MKKILITGAGGFIGQAVLNKLTKMEQWEIYALTRGEREFEYENVKTIKCDLLNLDGIDRLFAEIKPELTLHLAWKMTRASERFNADNILWLQVSLQILRAFVKNNGQRFIFAGSSAEYGGNGVRAADNSFRGFRETDSLQPDCLYGECKHAFGNIAQSLLTHMGKEYVHARIFPVYGPGEFALHSAPAAAAASFLRGDGFVCQAPNNLWDFVYIDDAATNLVSLLINDFCGVVNIASGQAVRVGEMFRLIADAAGRPGLLRLENTDKPGKALYGNTDRMNAVFNSPQITPIQQGIINAVNWRKELI